YADLAEKHRIKQPLNRLIRHSLQQAEFASHLPVAEPTSRDKPLLVIVLEWLTCQNSIYRSHSSTMRALRKHFLVAGIGLTGAT
ncbi:cobalt ABC transporter permease, partial [Salmonella enterica subsp. enterica serovar Braenderup]